MIELLCWLVVESENENTRETVDNNGETPSLIAEHVEVWPSSAFDEWTSLIKAWRSDFLNI